MYIIFINDKPLIITNSLETLNSNYKFLPVNNFEADNILEYFKSCESLTSKGLVLLNPDINATFLLVKKQLMPIEAAGGAVFNHEGQFLLIKRMGKWDLPKGKIDAGETKEIAALREVEEECGITELKLGSEITTTYHTYKMHNYRFLKITYWYFMTTNYAGILRPQQEEQITQAEWVNLNNLDLVNLDTYNSIKDLLYLVKSKHNLL